MLIKRELLHYLTAKYDEKASDNVTDEGMFGRPPMGEICLTVRRGGQVSHTLLEAKLSLPILR